MFFLRMQFEQNMHPEIVQLASVCIEELLDVFPTLEWRKEWAPSLVLRIAGANEGLFDSASGWLAVARRLPRTIRGTQLTTGLAMYVLQHRIDKTPVEGVSLTCHMRHSCDYATQIRASLCLSRPLRSGHSSSLFRAAWCWISSRGSWKISP